MPHYVASCHCGNLAAELTSDEPAVRICGCSFCRRHGARTATDPRGTARVHVTDPAALTRYRFGHETADFLVCARCGVYLGATEDDRFITLNINTFDVAPLDCGRCVSYEHEGTQERQARREASWTPIESFDVGE